MQNLWHVSTQTSTKRGIGSFAYKYKGVGMNAEELEVLVGLIWLFVLLAVAGFFLTESGKRSCGDDE